MLWPPCWWVCWAKWKVICCSQPMLLLGAAESRSADNAEAAPPQLYSRCMARQGQNNRMLHKAPQLLHPSLTPLSTNTAGELGHQVAHTVLTTSDTLPSVPLGLHSGPQAMVRPQRCVSTARPPPRKTERNETSCNLSWMCPRMKWEFPLYVGAILTGCPSCWWHQRLMWVLMGIHPRFAGWKSRALTTEPWLLLVI